MILKPSNWGDVQRYYENTYVKLPEYGDKLFYIYSVSEMKVLFKDSDGEEGIIYLSDDFPYDLNFVLPHKSLFQMGKYCYQMVRIPAKQYYRGITQENCSIFRLSNGSWRAQSLDWDLLNGYVSKSPFTTLSIAMKNGFHSAALSNRISWSGVGNYLYCDRIRIGQVLTDNNVLLLHPLFELEMKQLLLDMSNRTEYTIQYVEKV